MHVFFFLDMLQQSIVGQHLEIVSENYDRAQFWPVEKITNYIMKGQVNIILIVNNTQFLYSIQTFETESFIMDQLPINTLWNSFWQQDNRLNISCLQMIGKVSMFYMVAFLSLVIFLTFIIAEAQIDIFKHSCPPHI